MSQNGRKPRETASAPEPQGDRIEARPPDAGNPVTITIADPLRVAHLWCLFALGPWDAAEVVGTAMDALEGHLGTADLPERVDHNGALSAPEAGGPS